MTMMSEVLFLGIVIGMIVQFALDRTIFRGIAKGHVLPQVAGWLTRHDRE